MCTSQSFIDKLMICFSGWDVYATAINHTVHTPVIAVIDSAHDNYCFILVDQRQSSAESVLDTSMNQKLLQNCTSYTFKAFFGNHDPVLCWSVSATCRTYSLETTFCAPPGFPSKNWATLLYNLADKVDLNNWYIGTLELNNAYCQKIISTDLVLESLHKTTLIVSC